MSFSLFSRSKSENYTQKTAFFFTMNGSQSRFPIVVLKRVFFKFLSAWVIISNIEIIENNSKSNLFVGLFLSKWKAPLKIGKEMLQIWCLFFISLLNEYFLMFGYSDHRDAKTQFWCGRLVRKKERYKEKSQRTTIRMLRTLIIKKIDRNIECENIER